MKDPDNPKQWKIDEEAAEVVREIYQMIIQGYGTTKIANTLTERGVLNPTAYKAIHQIVNRKYTEEGKTIWSFKTIDRIITNQAYAGDTVNNRTGRVSYKVKKTVHYSEENWRVIPNTHEPIIERETWELVQKLFNGRRRRCTKHNYEAPLFTGHLFCADCGGKLYYVKPPEQAEYYCCCNYRKKLNGCTGHHIRADAVEELLIRKINSVIDFVSECEDEFTRQVMERENSDFQKETKALKKKADTAKHRLEQLDNFIAKLYEDKVMGEITADMFTKLSMKYVAEQQELNSAVISAQKELSELETKKTDTAKFIALVKRYVHIDELTPQILNEFIDKVTVFQAEKVDGVRKQKIKVYFNGVGEIEPDETKKPEMTA